ncbi:MAG: HD-GYP domain-containing protein [Brevinematia bacterium]
MDEKQEFKPIDVKFLKEGMILSGILYSEDGRLLWPARKPLTFTFIFNLKTNKTKFVYYSPPKFKESSATVENMFSTETLSFAVEAIEEISHEIKFGKLSSMNIAKLSIERFFHEMESFHDRFLNLMVLKHYDQYTYYHSINVGILSMYLTRKLGYNHLYTQDMGMAGFLHDIGKIKIPSKILNKDGPLTLEEFQIMKKHPVYAYEIIKNDPSISSFVKKAVLFHHERWNGTGYPLKLKEEAIGNFASIVAVADVYDALTTSRPYKKALSLNDTLIYILRKSDIYFNPYVANRFVNEMARMNKIASFYPVGAYVLLNTGETGYITKKDSEYTLRPEMLILKNFQGKPLRTPIQVDLKKDASRYIKKLIEEPSEIEFLSKLFKF